MSVGSRRVSVQSRLVLSRQRILAFRRRVGGLDVRMPEGSASAMRSDTLRRRVRSPSAGTVRVRRGSGRSSPTRSPRQRHAESSRGATSTSLGRRQPTGSPAGRDLEALGTKAFASLEGSLVPVRSPRGDEWLLADDEPTMRAPETAPAPARLLPSGDASCSTEQSGSFSSRRPTCGSGSARPACGRARCWSTARSTEAGDDRATPCGSTPGHAWEA